METFTSYQVELEKDKYKEVYDYDYSGADIEIKDPKIKKLIEGTDLVPILYMGENPYVFINPKTNEKFYYDGVEDKLHPFNEQTESKLNYLNSLSMKNKLVIPNEMLINHTTTTQPKLIQMERQSLLDESDFEMEVEEEEMIETEDIVEEEEQTESKPKHDSHVAKLMEKMNMTGFTNSFILSLVHELGSKEIKIKYMEDERDNLTDEDFQKLHSLSHEDDDVNKLNSMSHEDESIEIVGEEIQEEEQQSDYLPATTKPATTKRAVFKCPELVVPKNCKLGTKIITDKNTNCPKLVCDKKLKTIEIEEVEEVSDKIKLDILIVSMIVIVFTVILIVSFL